MPIKESSDELNPAVVTADSIPKTKTQRSSKDYLALAIATCGVGYIPLAPGTWGSLVAVVFYLILHGAWFPHTDISPEVYVPTFLLVQLGIIVVVTLVGTWAASRTERVSGRKDPGKVVVDEVAGQLIALMAVPAGLWTGLPVPVIVAFILFRFFDIVKPYPANKLERIPGGLGIMADDLVAGLYAYLGVILMRVVGL
jgi:phosphatidylglycerophosphatase A